MQRKHYGLSCLSVCSFSLNWWGPNLKGWFFLDRESSVSTLFRNASPRLVTNTRGFIFQCSQIQFLPLPSYFIAYQVLSFAGSLSKTHGAHHALVSVTIYFWTRFSWLCAVKLLAYELTWKCCTVGICSKFILVATCLKAGTWTSFSFLIDLFQHHPHNRIRFCAGILLITSVATVHLAHFLTTAVPSRIGPVVTILRGDVFLALLAGPFFLCLCFWKSVKD